MAFNFSFVAGELAKLTYLLGSWLSCRLCVREMNVLEGVLAVG